MAKDQKGYSRSIRRRFVGLFLLLVCIIFFPVFFFVRSWSASFYRKFDDAKLAQSYRFFFSYVDSRRQSLETLTKVYARESDILDFLERDKKATVADLVSIKQRAGVDLLTVLDESGNFVGGDQNSGIFETQSGPRKVWLSTLNGQIVSGFVFARSRQLWLLTLEPLYIPSAGRGCVGYLMMGIMIDSEFLENLGKEIDTGIQFVPADLAREKIDREPSEGVGNYRLPWQELMTGQQPYVISRVLEDDGERVYLSAFLRDIQGDVAAVLTLNYWAGRFPWSARNLVFFVWITVIFFIFSVYFIIWTLERYLTSPLKTLRGAFHEISSSGNLSRRLPVEVDDEIGGLISEFNSMMMELEKSWEKLKRSSADLSELYMDLLNQKKFTSEILATAMSIIIVILPDGRVKYINEAIERIAGFKPEEVIGRNWFDSFLPFRIRDDVRRVFESVLKNGSSTGSRQYQNEILAKDGTEHFILWSNSFFTDKEGRIESVLAIGQEITESKKVEDELCLKMRDMERFFKATEDREKIVMDLKREVAELRARVAVLSKGSL